MWVVWVLAIATVASGAPVPRAGGVTRVGEVGGPGGQVGARAKAAWNAAASSSAQGQDSGRPGTWACSPHEVGYVVQQGGGPAVHLFDGPHGVLEHWITLTPVVGNGSTVRCHHSTTESARRVRQPWVEWLGSEPVNLYGTC